LGARLVDQLPPQSVERLRRFVDLLDRWRKITNLISSRSFPDIWDRHIEDSIYVQRAASSARRWLDLGSGAGFPGIVIAVLIAEYNESQVHCVESDARKCAFLRAIAAELSIPVKVHKIRVEAISLRQTGPIDAVTARAFTSIGNFLELSREYISNGALAILPRGETSFREIESLDAERYIIETASNPGHEGGVIVVIRQRVTGIDG
jgi:16S rRNA (guanine527-N7)-methyltransferase